MQLFISIGYMFSLGNDWTVQFFFSISSRNDRNEKDGWLTFNTVYKKSFILKKDSEWGMINNNQLWQIK